MPGFLRGRRYRSLERSLDYLDLYEVEDPDTLRSAPYLARLNEPTPWTRRMVPHFLNTLRVGYRVTTSAGRGQGGVLLTMQLDAIDGGARPAGALAAGVVALSGRDRGRLGARAGRDARGHEHRDRGEAPPRPGDGTGPPSSRGACSWRRTTRRCSASSGPGLLAPESLRARGAELRMAGAYQLQISIDPERGDPKWR